MTDIATVLAEIPDLAAEVWMTRDAPNPAPRADRHIRSVPGSRPPVNLDVIDILRTDPADYATPGLHDGTSHLLDALGMCVRMVAEERDLDGLDGPDEAYGAWSPVCAYLVATAAWWSSRPGLSEDVTHDVTRVHKTLQRAARVPREPRLRCTRCGDRARMRDGGSWLGCDSGHVIDHRAEIARAMAIRPPMTISQIAEELGERRDTIKKWIKRRDLEPAEVRRGTRLYDIELIQRKRAG